jgi:hypothetical protein
VNTLVEDGSYSRVHVEHHQVHCVGVGEGRRGEGGVQRVVEVRSVDRVHAREEWRREDWREGDDCKI